MLHKHLVYLCTKRAYARSQTFIRIFGDDHSTQLNNSESKGKSQNKQARVFWSTLPILMQHQAYLCRDLDFFLPRHNFGIVLLKRKCPNAIHLFIAA